jgi:hypothetical protein
VTRSTLSRQIDVMMRTAVKYGLTPHVWIDTDGQPHVAHLTEVPKVAPIAADPWDDLVSGQLKDQIRKEVRRPAR